MRELLFLAVHLIVTLAKLARPGGIRRVIAASLLLKHQLILSGRSRRHAPRLTTLDRFVFGLTTMFVHTRRVENGNTPQSRAGNPSSSTANLARYDCKSYCNGLFEILVAA